MQARALLRGDAMTGLLLLLSGMAVMVGLGLIAWGIYVLARGG